MVTLLDFDRLDIVASQLKLMTSRTVSCGVYVGPALTMLYFHSLILSVPVLRVCS